MYSIPKSPLPGFSPVSRSSFPFLRRDDIQAWSLLRCWLPLYVSWLPICADDRFMSWLWSPGDASVTDQPDWTLLLIHILSAVALIEFRRCSEIPWQKCNFTKHRLLEFKARILRLESSVIWFTSKSSGRSPGPVSPYHPTWTWSWSVN